MDQETETLEAALGRALRQERELHGLTLDQVATAAREYGLRWSTARVIEFEKGKLRVTVPMLLVLTQVLQLLVGRPYALSDLVPDDAQWVKVTDSWSTPRHLVREVLDGMPGRLPIIVGDIVESSGFRLESTTEEHVRELADPLTATLAEQRAARRLNVRPRQVAMWSQMLWGSHLDEEVSRRAGAESSAQARGHVTRELVDEIARKIGEHDGID